ncbi:chromosomal replication initiator protein DnaA [Candidatus Peregrinibacteria bacterium]|jgi:chromosomal replication initiator protein|nr:chromosomal replication initiator protein DnaA [Candidatus Peregrinibacteria bacterium]
MNFKELWSQLLEKLQPRIKRAHFVTWFQDTGVIKNENGVLIVGVPNPFAGDWIKSKYLDTLLELAKEVDPTIESVEIEVHSSLSAKDHAHKVDVKKINSPVVKKTRKLPNKNEVKLIEGISSRCLNPKYTLDNYVVGPGNRLAHAAASAVSVKPGSTYNPLFVYGGVGLGKTHLLQSIGNEILRNFPDKTVVYVTSEKFTNEIVEAIQKYDSKKFKQKYRNVDCLIIDDIQFLANKDRTQVEFFHTFNELYDMNKQIVISSDRPPKELSGLEDRLVNRFEMGMIVDVQMPDFETRLAILQKKVQNYEALVPVEVLEFIAYHCQSSVRELEGVLKQAMAQADLENSMPTVKSVAAIMDKLCPKREYKEFVKEIPRIITDIEEVIRLVSDYYNVTPDNVVGTGRKREFMVPRQVCMYLVRNELKQSYEHIGEEFGGRNHTTVMHACDKVNGYLKYDQRLVRDINALKREMGM